ncbi:hypothetical protein C7212DRAFT_320328 [Tuber magnatum]|uniref:Uncharacterized protein n=1 Tax=Tuber magnatum TaxID=42249 RepID=A0A317ST91_9PEZI|nr:hypothetical protein C7212DRAFT_320328 [Tuber magnatum]
MITSKLLLALPTLPLNLLLRQPPSHPPNLPLKSLRASPPLERHIDQPKHPHPAPAIGPMHPQPSGQVDHIAALLD